MKDILLYIGNFSFPKGNAAGKRVYANGKIFRDLGYKVLFIGLDRVISKNTPLSSTKRVFDDFEYYNFPYPKNALDWINYRSRYERLIQFLQNEKIISNLKLIVYYGSPSISIFILKLIKYCRKKNIGVIADCVDWLKINTNDVIFNYAKSLDDFFIKSYLNKRVDGVIAISSFLRNYYSKNMANVVIIPPLTTDICKMFSSSYKSDEYKTIIYAGIPFRKGTRLKNENCLKDRIDIVIKMLSTLEGNSKYVFAIYGFTKEEYLYALPKQEKYIKLLDKKIKFYGEKSNDEVITKYLEADFSILLRDSNRESMAGFPTKISESISYGVPVIINKTSDLENYIIEGINGFFIDQSNMNDATNKIKTILKMQNEEVAIMKNNCASSKTFYYKNYETKVKLFVEDVRKRIN